MGEVASVMHGLSCKDCAKFVCNDMSMRSQCCDDEDGCNCDVVTHETMTQDKGEEIEVVMDNGCDGWCCNCLVKAHK